MLGLVKQNLSREPRGGGLFIWSWFIATLVLWLPMVAFWVWIAANLDLGFPGWISSSGFMSLPLMSVLHILAELMPSHRLRAAIRLRVAGFLMCVVSIILLLTAAIMLFARAS